MQYSWLAGWKSATQRTAQHQLVPRPQAVPPFGCTRLCPTRLNHRAAAGRAVQELQAGAGAVWAMSNRFGCAAASQAGPCRTVNRMNCGTWSRRRPPGASRSGHMQLEGSLALAQLHEYQSGSLPVRAAAAAAGRSDSECKQSRGDAPCQVTLALYLHMQKPSIPSACRQQAPEALARSQKEHQENNNSNICKDEDGQGQPATTWQNLAAPAVAALPHLTHG